ncbi:hypothetical protein FRB96_002446 [Tulasnella sp. 330]|nr:hypothetical protein FRB96_002446 [Tulasnella sp. 330]
MHDVMVHFKEWLQYLPQLVLVDNTLRWPLPHLRSMYFRGLGLFDSRDLLRMKNRHGRRRVQIYGEIRSTKENIGKLKAIIGEKFDWTPIMMEDNEDEDDGLTEGSDDDGIHVFHVEENNDATTIRTTTTMAMRTGYRWSLFRLVPSVLSKRAINRILSSRLIDLIIAHGLTRS